MRFLFDDPAEGHARLFFFRLWAGPSGGLKPLGRAGVRGVGGPPSVNAAKGVLQQIWMPGGPSRIVVLLGGNVFR